ncbi:MAG: P-II family nitrogen regulator [Clostridiales bacterium]
MSEQLSPQEKMIKMIVTIVDRGKGQRVVDICLKHNIHVHFICLGMGTANSEILDYLGLGETDKDVVISMAPQFKIPKMFEAINTEMQLKRPGKGIIFTMPLSGISGPFARVLTEEERDRFEKEVNKMEESVKHDLILAVINQGHKEEVMAAAREAGATGGTVIHARNVGQETERFLGICIQPEKDIIGIIVKREHKQAIMKAISQVAGLNTACKGLIFALPVDSLVGID